LIRDEYLAHRAQGFTVIAINFGDESSDTVRKFWSSYSLQPAPFLDPDGSVASSYGVALNNTGLPVSVLVARDGIISSYEPFPLTKDFIDTALAKVL
jgi:peroxiredoxin